MKPHILALLHFTRQQERKLIAELSDFLVLVGYFLGVNLLILLFAGAALSGLGRLLIARWHKQLPVTSLDWCKPPRDL